MEYIVSTVFRGFAQSATIGTLRGIERGVANGISLSVIFGVAMFFPLPSRAIGERVRTIHDGFLEGFHNANVAGKNNEPLPPKKE